MQVFISHAVQDRELARKISHELTRAGLHVWNPDSEIFPGDNWAKKLGQALDESEIMIALVTANALKSGSLRHDIQFALTSKNYGGRVLPVLVDQAKFEAGTDVPWILLQLDPVYIESAHPVLEEVTQRVKSISETDLHAAR